MLLDPGSNRGKWVDMRIGASGFLRRRRATPGPHFVKRIERFAVTEYIESGAFAENDTMEDGIRVGREGCDTDFTSNGGGPVAVEQGRAVPLRQPP